MSQQQLKLFIIWSMPLYFGWLLSFPWHGPILYHAAPVEVLNAYPLVLIFAFCHALTYLLGGILLKNTELWYRLMRGSLIVTFAANAMLLLPYSWVWPPVMAVMGVCSALYVLGWSCIYALSSPVKDLLKIMAAIMIIANLIFVLYNLLAAALLPQILLVAALAPLGAALLFLLRVPFAPAQALHRPKLHLPLPGFLVIVLCLFVFSLFLNGGLMYTIMLPALDVDIPFFSYYRFIPYILVLLVMYQYGERLQRYFSLYMGVSLLGLAFVSFALVNNTTAGFLMTAGLVEAAFALLDLFVWTILGSLAFIYGAPYPFFGFVISSMIASIVLGNLVGERLLHIGENHRLVTAVFAAASIFLAFTVMPWLNQRIDQNLSRVLQNEDTDKSIPDDSSLLRLMKYLLPGQHLTPREEEITRLVLQGLTNEEIAMQLFISKNTVKTHLKNICSKFGVNQKRELFFLALRK